MKQNHNYNNAISNDWPKVIEKVSPQFFSKHLPLHILRLDFFHKSGNDLLELLQILSSEFPIGSTESRLSRQQYYLAISLTIMSDNSSFMINHYFHQHDY